VLANQAIENGINYISGKDFYKQQFIKQFEIYTEIQINEHDFNKTSFRR
jgi:shikimate 5-dehydrogenase